MKVIKVMKGEKGEMKFHETDASEVILDKHTPQVIDNDAALQLQNVLYWPRHTN
jgi:hypothetical protein